tara:strand:- start:169 stop:702 length:534 start_codon:yes stop_codon:yes gene_type:complete
MINNKFMKIFITILILLLSFNAVGDSKIYDKSLFCEKDDFILYFEFLSWGAVEGYFLAKDTNYVSKRHDYYTANFKDIWIADDSTISLKWRGMFVSRKTLRLYLNIFNNSHDKTKLNIEDINEGKIFEEKNIQCQLNKMSKFDAYEYIETIGRKYNSLLKKHLENDKNQNDTSDNLL